MEESGETVGVNPLQTMVHGFTIDLVRNLTGENNSPAKFEAKELEHKGNGRFKEEGEIELSLGLSLNGKLGFDPKRTQAQLFRASSMSACTLKCDENQTHEAQFGVDASPLIRTCSLPNVIVEELRKRKALQTLRRVEAKKRRMDKLSNSKEGKEKVVDYVYNQNCNDQGFVCNIDGDEMMPLLVHGSELGSQGSGSSGISELESNSIQGGLTNEAKAPNSNHCQLPETDRNLAFYQLPETDRNLTFKIGPTNNIHSRQCHRISDHKPPIAPRAMSSRDRTSSEEEEKKKKMEDLRKKMPSVTTIGKGQNGKKIEGLLYRYKKGEEVKIVCVCHGSMFSPAQFVRHAGGLDVDYPLRHIVVTSPPCL